MFVSQHTFESSFNATKVVCDGYLNVNVQLLPIILRQIDFLRDGRID
jgi:hypothetical protein